MADEQPTVHQAMAVCALDYCHRPMSARGWCKKHYECWRRHGDPEGGSRIVGDVEGNFWRKVSAPDARGCWPWTGAISGTGYGLFSPPATRGVAAHRYSYELLIGVIPDGLTIDHLCFNRICCNPAHMEPVTRGENARRGQVNRLRRNGRARPDLTERTHCKNGHEFTAENTRRVGNARHCRECQRERSERFKRRRRGEVPNG